MAVPPTTWLHVSGYRFLLRRVECALLGRDGADAGACARIGGPIRALAAGSAVASLAAVGCAALAVLHPQGSLDDAPIVMSRPSGALYVRVGDIWHPVLNLASARLIAATDANPQPVAESALRRTKRGPLLGIPGAPQSLPAPLPGDQTRWAVCDGAAGTTATTTVVVGAVEGPTSHRLSMDQTVLVTADSGAATYLLYGGRRALVNLDDPVVAGALRTEGRRPRRVSRALLHAIPESPPIAAPRIRGAGSRGPGALAGFPVGAVLRATRADGDEYYVVLRGGVQRVGRVTADLLRLAESHGARTIIAVAPDLIAASRTVTELPVSTFPDRIVAPVIADGTTLCAWWASVPSGGADIAVTTGDGLPVPAGQTPVALAQADGAGPAVDAAYVPPGRSAYVRSVGLIDVQAHAGTRYVITDTGVRFAVHDDAAAHDLGLPAAAPAPWPVLATLPSGPELSRANASVARDTVGVGDCPAANPP
ncbi:type VII secretion protein EccB [Mycobacterium sp.]|uniref:type VII secretion protein EccB n=1 Tax=Mycobacterium sp. TaxID=1785 RepID=UPI0012868E0C|nr:type VII secretion protein EccB [Mycobacterium sp.]KAA8966125.1 MAG: type VII secretion protein EccB [Mycobacterium sp.]